MNDSGKTGTQLNPLDMSACTASNVRKASRAISQVYDAALQPVNLKSTQFTVLATLSKSGQQPLSQLADAMVMDRTTLTRNLQPLLKRKLVTTSPGEDRRVRNVQLTRQGKRLLDRALPLWRTAQSHLVGGLGQKRWTRLLGDLAATVSLTQG